MEIARALPYMRFVMIGSPRDLYIRDRLMRERPNNLSYLGAVSNRSKVALIRLSSAGITTSKYEGFGLIPLEFLLAGKPVLTYPLPTFHELYGDLLVYANNIPEFIEQLSELRRKRFKVKIDESKIALLRTQWNISQATWRIIRLLNIKSAVVFSEDYEKNSSTIFGCDLVNWKIWRQIRDRGVQMQVLASGVKYSEAFHMEPQTTQIGRRVAFLRRIRISMNKNSSLVSERGLRSDTPQWSSDMRGAAKILDVLLCIAEPLSYVLGYMRNKRRIRASDIVTCNSRSAITAGIIVKCLFRSRLICVIHDTGFYDIELPNSSFPWKVYFTMFSRCLRYVDRIITVSQKTQNDLSRFCDSNRIILLWGRS